MTIIEQLKKNEKPFGLMSVEMQEKAREIGAYGNFCIYMNSGFATLDCLADYIFEGHVTYRLRDDYEEKPEIVECEITMCLVNGLLYDPDGHGMLSISEAIKSPDFIGFKFEDGVVKNTPTDVAASGAWPNIAELQSRKTKALYATHALFWGQKK